MKKLNLNIAIATTAMLTKMNTMKNRLNFFAKVFMLVAVMGIFMPKVAFGQGWIQTSDGTWYIFNGSWERSDDENNIKNAFVYAPYACSITGTLSFYMSANANNSTEISYYDNINKDHQTIAPEKNCGILVGVYCAKSQNDPYKKTVTVSNGATAINYGCTKKNSNTKDKNVKLVIPVPQHADVKNATLSKIDFGEVEMNQIAHYDIEFTSLFTSFMATNGFTLTSSTTEGTSGGGFFTSSNATETTLSNICGNNSVYAEPNNTQLSGNAGLVKGTDNKYYLRLYFKPTSSTATYSGSFDLKLGNNTIITIPVKGKGGKISPGITWTENTDLNVGNSVVNPATVSPDNIAVTYSSADNSKIAVNGNTLIALATTEPNKVTITATTTASGDYKSITSTKDFMVTNKQIQSISWNQKFTNLKVGDNDIQLDATATSGGSITYWVENNSTNVVTINNGYLHIVETGDVKIYAKQVGGIIGGQEWLEVETYKQVKVRAVGAACEECAIESNGEWSSALSDQKSYTYYVKSKNGLNTPTGNVLKFHYSAGSPSPYYELTVKVDGENVGTYSGNGNIADKDAVITLTGANVKENIQNVSFEWKSTFIGGWSASTVKISEVCLSQLSYLRQGTTTSYDFGNVQFGSSQAVYLENIAKFSALSSAIDAKIVNEGQGFTNASSFKIIDTDGAETDETSIDVDCSDFGNLAINLKFTPQELGNLSAKLMLIGYKGNQQETIYVELYGACFSTPSLEFNNDCFTDKPVFDANGNYYQQTLSVATNSGATPSYTLVNTPREVAEINGNQLKIKKAEVDITVRVHIDASGYYYERNLDSTFRATTVSPTLAWKVNTLGTKAYKIGDEIEVKNLVIQLYSANDAAQYLGNITVSAKDASGAEMLESATVGNINTAKVRVTKAGEIVSLTVSTPAVTNYFTAESQPITSGCGEFDKKSQSITWNPQTNLKVGDNVAHDATAATEISYASGNTEIISNDGHCNKAGYTTHKVTAAETWEYHNAESEKNFHVDFADDFVLNCIDAVIGTPSITPLDMSQHFVPSGNGEYTVSSSSTEFVVTKQNNSNYITIVFSPTAVNSADNDTEEKEAIITINDNDQTYSFKVKATAEKKDADLTISCSGETFAFSTITLSNTKSTIEEVTYYINEEAITGSKYKIPSITPITITATTPSNNIYKAGSASIPEFTPKAVTPKVTNWSGSYADQKMGGSISLGQADWDVDENVSGQPAKTEWATDEVTISYTSSESRIAEVSGSDLVFHRAGVATITAEIKAEKSHNASTSNPPKRVKVDFADEGVNCGTAYAGETPAVADITDMIVSVGTISDLKASATSTNSDFEVIVNNDRLEVRFDPTSYHEETSTAIITFTDTDGEVYYLNVQGECQKHTPVIEWRSDVQTIAIAQDENDIKTETDLIDATNSQYYQPLKFKSGDDSKVKVYDENYAEAEWGIYLYPIGKGPVTIYAKAEETENHYASTEASEKQFTVIGEAKSKIAWNQNFLRIYNDQTAIPLTAEVQASSNSEPIAGATVTYHLLDVQNNVVTLNGSTLNITAGATGTAKIYAEFAGNDDYVGCVSETLNISVIARISGGCNTITYNDVTSKGNASEVIYYFNNNKYSAGEPYFEVEKITALATAKGDKGGGIILGDGASRSIKSTFGSNTQTTTGPGGKRGFIEGSEPDPVTANHIYQPNEGDNTQFIKFSGDIGINNSNTFTGIEVTPRSYVKQVSLWDNPFADGITEVGDTRTEQFTIATYSNLSDYDIALWEPGTDDRAYSGGEFRIISSTGDRYPITCPADNTVDFGEWKITVEFKPTSGKTEKNPHKCRIRITYKKGSNGQDGGLPIYLPIEAQAKRIDQPAIIWNQDLSSLTSLSTQPTGENWDSGKPIELTAKSGLSESDYYGTLIMVDAYEITAGTDVAEIVNDKYLSIKKAGQFTIKATHNGDDKYEGKHVERRIDVALSAPTIELSHIGTPIAENETINVTYNDPSITIDSKAMYGDFEIYGYTIESGKIELSSSALDVVSIANDNQLQFLKSGDATITATITEDDIVFGKTFTFNVHVNKAQAGLHWDDVTKYANDWIYVFDTKSMTALADNNDNNGAISYDVTNGKASFSGNDITINGYGSITARAIIATTDKYLADTITKTFTPKKVTPVVTWNGDDFTTDMLHSEFTLTDAATVTAAGGQPDVSVWDEEAKTIVYSSITPNVATLKSGETNTFELHKVGYATIQAQVNENDNIILSNPPAERHLKVDFSPNYFVEFGTVGVYSTSTINFDLSAIEADGHGEVSAKSIGNDVDFTYGNVVNNKLPITFKPQSHDAANPLKTTTLIIYDYGNGQEYHLVVKGTTALAQPSLKFNDQNYAGWNFVVQLPNTTTEVVYGGSSYDIQWNTFPNSDLRDNELKRIELSLKDPVCSTYVDITDNSHFVVKQANEGNDNSIVDVVLVATYPGIENQIAGTSIEIPIKITKNQYSLNWNKTDGFSIEVYQQSLPLAAPTQTPEGGESVIEYSFSEEGIGTYDGTTFTLTGPPYKSGKLIASIASDKYAVGTSAELDIKVKKTEQTVTWAGNEIKNGFTTQKSTTEGIQLTAEAYRGSSTKTNANIRYEVTENSNCGGEGDLISLDVNKDVTPWVTTLFYTGNGSGTVSIKAIAEETDEYNESKADDLSASPIVTFDITREGCNVNNWTVSDMRYGDKVVLAPTVDKITRGKNYGYTLPDVTGELTVDGNVLNAKGVGTSLTISAKKLEDCWVNESEGSTESNTFNITKSEQEIEWDKRVLGTPQEEAYHFSVLDNTEYQLGTQAIDKLHKNADATCLTLVDGKYVTANVSGNAPGELSLVYSVEKQNDVCKVGEDEIVSVDDGGKMHITGNGTGTVLVIASVDGGNYYENVSETITVVIDKVTPTVSVTGPVGALIYGTGPHTLTASSTVGSYSSVSDPNAAFTYTVTEGTDVASVNGNQLTILKAGTVKVTATQTANCIVNSATSEGYTIVISKAEADFFSIADITMTYNDEARSLDNDISGGILTPGTDYQVSYSVGDNGIGFFNVDNANKTISPLKSNVDENGDFVEMTLNASITGMTNYNDKQITGKVYVQRATQAIVWSGVQTSYDTWNDGGEKTVTLDDYAQSQDASHDNNNITPDLTKTYELAISDKGCVIEDASVAYIDNNVLHITGAASATLTIYAKQDGTDDNGENYTKIEKTNNCTTVITINKITPTITFERSNVNGGEDVYYSDEVTYTVSSTGNDYSVSDVSAFTFNVIPVDDGAISENKASHAGNVKIKASQAEDCMINEAESGEVDVEIKKAPQSVSWNVTDLGTLSAISTGGVELTAVAMNSRRNTQSGMTITYTVCDAQSNDITSGALITIGDDNKVYSAHNGSGEAWVKAVANGNYNYEVSEVPVLKKITITNATPTISWADPCSEQMTMNYREEKELTFSCNYTGYTASYTLAEPSDDTYVDITELANGKVKIIGVKPDNGTIGIKVTISDLVGNYSDGELTTAITTLKNNTEIVWEGQSFRTYTTADAGTEIELTAYVKDLYKEDNSGKAVSYDFKGTDKVANCGNIVELTDDGKLKITGNAAGTVTLYASYAGDDNYNASTEKSMQITVGKQTPSFVWADGADIQATYGDEGVTAGEITKDGDGAVTYGSSEPTVAMIDENGSITIVGAGTTTISATLAADCKYEAVTTAITKTLIVAKAAQTITWDQPFGNDIDVMSELSFTASSNIFRDGIYYTADPVGILGKVSEDHVAIYDNLVQILKSGTVNVTAHHPGNENYEPAESETKQIVIHKHKPTVVWNPDPTGTYEALTKKELNATTDGPYTYGDITIGYEIVSTSPGGCASINGNTVTFISQGTVVVKAKTIANTEDRYEEGSVEDTLTINPSTQGHTITWNQSPTENIDYKTQLTFSATSDKVTDNPACDWYEVVTETGDDSGVFGVGNDGHIIINNGYVQIIGVGKAHVKAHHPGNSVYAAAYSEVQEIVVRKASPELNWTIAPTSIVYNGTLDLKQSYTAVVDNTFDGTYSYSSSETSIITVDNSGNVTAIGNAGSSATVTVTMSEAKNYSGASINTTITIGKGTPDLAWNESFDFTSLTNKVDDFDLTGAATCSNVTNITYSVEDNTNVSVSEGHKLKIDYDGTDGVTFTLKATVSGGDNYNDLTISKEIEVATLSPIEIIVKEETLDLGTTNPQVTSVTNDVDFATLLKNNNAISCNYNNVTYTFMSSDETIAEFDNEGKIIAYKKSDEGLSVTVTAHVEGLTDEQATMSIKIPRGTMVFQYAGNWNVNSNWLRRDMLPSAEDHNVSIAANCTVNVTTAECWDMEIADNGTLTISTDGILNVADTLLNNDISKLVISADANGQGTLVFHNKKAMPMATVEMWCKGSETGTGTNGKNINPNWQYRGIAVSSATLPSDENAPDLIYKWNEQAHESDAETGITEQWDIVRDNQMKAWKGYAVAKYTVEGADYKTSAAGALTNADQEITLAFSSDQQSGDGVQSGFNLITNSFTAPLNYSKLVYNDGIEQGVVLFNTGKYVDWKNSEKQILSEGNAAGQYIFLPKNTGGEIASDVIPSGESFFVVVTDANAANKSITIPYSAVEQQVNGALRMPERREIYGKLIVEVDGGEGADRLYLLENKNRIRGFENGYDGPKYAGTKGNPMLYATTDDGRMSVSADSSLLGLYIGFAAGKHDVTYTMTFDASALSGYSELYLYDTREKRYTNILDGGSYTFKGLVGGEDKRFKIVGSREDGESVTGDDQTIIVTGNRFHVTGYDNADERIYLVDMTGKILWETSTALGPWFDIPTDLPTGVYIIKTANHTAKMVVK